MSPVLRCGAGGGAAPLLIGSLDTGTHFSPVFPQQSLFRSYVAESIPSLVATLPSFRSH